MTDCYHDLEQIYQYQTIEVTIEIENKEILEYLNDIIVSIQQQYKIFNYSLLEGNLSVDYNEGILYFEMTEEETGKLKKGEPLSIMINGLTNNSKRVVSDKYTIAQVESNIYDRTIA